MKFFKKIILPVIAGVCAIAAFATLTACDSNPDANLTDDQYAVYVYLEDGTTGVEGVEFQLCYSVNSSQSTCSGTSYVTDSNGRVLFDMTEITYVNAPVIHIVKKYVADTSGNYVETYTCLPDGYDIPADASKQTLNDGASYEDAWALTEKVTTLTLNKA